MGAMPAGTDVSAPVADSGEQSPPTPAGKRARSRARYVRLASAAGLAAVLAALFFAYLGLSRTYPENSDEANILLMAWDMLHGNVVLHGWYMSDVSFYTTELPQYALLESFLGLHADTAHVAAAMTYTLAVVLAVLLAKGQASGRVAVVRALTAAGILLAPQLGGGVFALDLSVGHLGTSVPLMLVWLLVDRARRRWYVPVLTAAGLAWVLVADPLVLVIGVLPLALASVARVIRGVFGAGGLLLALRSRWYELSLAAAAAAAWGLAWGAERALAALGGYYLNPLPFTFASAGDLNRTVVPALSSIPLVFGAAFRGLSGVQYALAVLHVVSLVLVILAVLRVLVRFFGGITLVEQVLAVAIVANVAAYALTTAAFQGAHEIAVVVPFGAVLTARMLASPVRARRRSRRGWRARIPAIWAWVPNVWVRVTRAAGYAAGAAVLAGYLAGLAYEAAQPAAPPANTALTSWLMGHGLRYGLGGYWESSIVTVESGGQVDVRSLRLHSLQRNLWMAKLPWYDPTANVATFVVLDSGPGYLNNWEPRALVSRYFGVPAHVYSFGPYTVLVWNDNLLPLVPPTSSSPSGRPQPPAGPPRSRDG
ncbi:MAG: hypothetical protein JOY82_23530 [Streptosporangiaceae bacterium]|nr:hypothetical protein [Streptosporangiaceae bacterium]MBV9857455.1 hypothetical protein [Streptosporangiaceae bacterium]